MLSNFYVSSAFQVARLTDEDMIVVNNLRMLGGQPDTKKRSTGAFGLKFDINKVIVF
jgi:syntaxin-binding protein 1